MKGMKCLRELKSNYMALQNPYIAELFKPHLKQMEIISHKLSIIRKKIGKEKTEEIMKEITNEAIKNVIPNNTYIVNKLNDIIKLKDNN